LTFDFDVHERIAWHAFIDNEQVNVAGRTLLEHADRLKIDVDPVPLILCLDLMQQIPSHCDPSNLRTCMKLQRFGD
jgi:hypothetical protein